MTGERFDRSEIVRSLIDRALAEDVGAGDWTTLWTVPAAARGDAVIVAKESLVVAGSDIMAQVFRAVDPDAEIELFASDGAALEREETLARIRGSARALLTAERTALNFLGRLSGIATLTAGFVAEASASGTETKSGAGVRIIDTRKTTPGFRILEKEAVRAGGGSNHRMGLHDMIMIKDNHAMAAGGIRPALERVRAANAAGLPVEVEVSTFEELQDALDGRPDRILLDNMPLELLREAVRRARAREAVPELEASGNMTLDRVRAVAETGVDLISVGALTHSAPSADFSMRMKPPE